MDLIDFNGYEQEVIKKEIPVLGKKENLSKRRDR